MTREQQQRAEVAKVVLRLFGAWGRVPPDEAYEGYWLALKTFAPSQLEQALADAVRAGGEQPPAAGNFARFAKPPPRLPEVPWRRRESWLNETPPTQAEMAASQDELADAAGRRFLASRDAYDRHPYGSLEQDSARRAMDEARSDEQHFRRAAAFHREQDEAGTPAGAFGELLAAVVGRARR